MARLEARTVGMCQTIPSAYMQNLEVKMCARKDPYKYEEKFIPIHLAGLPLATYVSLENCLLLYENSTTHYIG